MYAYIKRLQQIYTFVQKVRLCCGERGGKYKISWVDRRKSFAMLNHRSKIIIFPPLSPPPSILSYPVKYSPCNSHPLSPLPIHNLPVNLSQKLSERHKTELFPSSLLTPKSDNCKFQRKEKMNGRLYFLTKYNFPKTIVKKPIIQSNYLFKPLFF